MPSWYYRLQTGDLETLQGLEKHILDNDRAKKMRWLFCHGTYLIWRLSVFTRRRSSAASVNNPLSEFWIFSIWWPAQSFSRKNKHKKSADFHWRLFMFPSSLMVEDYFLFSFPIHPYFFKLISTLSGQFLPGQLKFKIKHDSRIQDWKLIYGNLSR